MRGWCWSLCSLRCWLAMSGCVSQTYAWLVLESLSSEVLTRDEWLCLTDVCVAGAAVSVLWGVDSRWVAVSHRRMRGWCCSLCSLRCWLAMSGCVWQTYAWLVLESLFSEVLTRDEWLCLMDNVFSNHPSFLLVCVVAYCVIGRTALLRCTDRDDFEVCSHCVAFIMEKIFISACEPYSRHSVFWAAHRFCLPDLASSHWVHSLCLDYFVCVRFFFVLYLHACCIIVTWWGEPG